jgi:ABC-2 type transport system permease protein
MTGFRAFFGKEIGETLHTWRIWVLPGFLLFSALTAPLITYFMPALMDMLGSEETGLAIQVPDPTAATAFAEYLGNLRDIVMLALVIAYGGIVSSELRSGTGALTLAKPLSRSAFVCTKWLSQLLVVAAAGVAGTAICIGITGALLGSGPTAALAAGVGLWVAFAAFLLSAMVLLSVTLRAPAAASGAGVGIYIGLTVIGQFELLSRSSPAGLMSSGIKLVLGQPTTWVMPLLTALAATAVLLAVAVWLFARREI